MGEYLYCIIGENKEKSFGCIGINNQEVKLVPYKDIAAVISSTPIINFDRLDKKELTRYVAAHQKVNEEVMKGYDVVPMSFGIIAPSISEVSRILEKAYLQFKTALKNIAGKVEFAVHVWWNPQKILEELANTNLEIQRESFINDIQQILGSISFGSTQNKLSDGEMLVNFSFLIEKLREPELDKKMQGLGEKYDGKLRFKYIGPMPSYSFVNINLGLGNFELIDGARKLLGLPEVATFKEIKRTYYELSHRYHPDKVGGDEAKMKKIAQDYGILESYCRSCDEFEGRKRDEKYSFKKENVENSLIIK